MKLQWPWAKREHYHLDPTFLRYNVCSNCGHLLLTDHVENRRVEVHDRHRCVFFNEIYAKGCAPNYSRKEIGIDGEASYYREKNGIWVEVDPGIMDC